MSHRRASCSRAATTLLLVALAGSGCRPAAEAPITETPEAGAPEAAEAARRGLEVEEIGEGSALEAAGLRPGDRLLAWRRPPGSTGAGPPVGELVSLCDWQRLMAEEAERNRLLLLGARDGAAKVFEVAAGLWKTIEVRPIAGTADPGGTSEVELYHHWRSGRKAEEDGDWEQARDAYRRALALAPAAPCEIELHQNLGWVLQKVGDLEEAAVSYRTALAIAEAVPDLPLHRATSGYFLAYLAKQQGELGTAYEQYRRACDLYQRASPLHPRLGECLINLGNVAEARGDLDKAEEHHRRALPIYRRINPDSPAVATLLNNLGVLAQRRGDLEQAEERYLEALEIYRAKDDFELYQAMVLNNLGDVAFLRRAWPQAEERFTAALGLYETLAPGSLAMAQTLSNLGDAALQSGDWEPAEGFLERALALVREVAPGTETEAIVLNNLGTLARRRSRLEEAETWFRRAFEVLGAQTLKVGGTPQTRAQFRARHGFVARNLVATLVDEDRPEAAFAVVEQSRARSFLELLAEREAARGAAEVPAELAALHRRHIRPLGWPKARQTLDPGTVLLAYSVGKDESDLFVGAAGGELRALRLAIGDEAGLQRRVEALRRLLAQNPAEVRWRQESFHDLARQLYDQLLAPAEAHLAAGERLLIVPDGPLHLLPWGALLRRTADGGSEYLVESKPFSTAVSLTVFGEMRQLRGRRRGEGWPAAGGPVLAAFGDPDYDDTDDGDPEDGDAAHLEPLPGTRREVERIADLFGASARRYLGPEATEEAARALGPGVDYVHFAVHGLYDERFPLDSALVFTPPETPAGTETAVAADGRLHSWEILDSIHLDAELVVLSACESGLGEELAGEGLIGLTRAFHHAGARSVVASLWKVADDTTAELMEELYRRLRRGSPKDEALRSAQLALLRGPAERAASPYYWAGFQVSGDAR